MKKFLSLLLCLVMVFSACTTVFAADEFEDIDGHWAASSILRWAEAGIIEGVDDEGTLFNPSGIMTRGQAATIFARLLKLTVKADVSNFKDLEGNAYAEAIALCVEAGILEGMSSSIMDPDGTLTLSVTADQSIPVIL